MRKFRVIAVLEGTDLPKCFTVFDGLKRQHKGEAFRSLRAAEDCAREWVQSGWYPLIVRRVPNGWANVPTNVPYEG
jgi:hypothetical protein